MLSSKRILKANNVTVDSDNKVLIDVTRPEWLMEKDEMSMEDDSDSNVRPEELAESLVAAATRKSEAIVQDALKEAEDIIEKAKKQAIEEGKQIMEGIREQGHQEGLRKAQDEANAIRAQANTILDDAINDRREMEASLEPDMVNLIIKIVSKLLDDTAKINPQIIINLIKQGLAGSTITGNVTIHVSPHDYEAVANNKDTILSMADGTVHLDIKSDLSLNAMDCIIETPYGNIDCSLGQQFETLSGNLTYILNNA